MRVAWTTLARHDLRDIYDYIATDNPDAARRIQAVVRSRIGSLVDTPFLGRQGRVEGTRELIITGTPYIVAYRIEMEEIQILRVRRGARTWPVNFE